MCKVIKCVEENTTQGTTPQCGVRTSAELIVKAVVSVFMAAASVGAFIQACVAVQELSSSELV